MKVLVGSKNYDVRWERWWVPGYLAKSSLKPENVETDAHPMTDEEASCTNCKLMVTKCIVSEIDESKSGRERYNPICNGIAVQGLKDAPNKFSGRKYSLTRAIQDMDKNTRKEFWRVFVLNQLKVEIEA